MQYKVWWIIAVYSLIFLLSMVSCRMTYLVRNQQQTTAEIFAVPCGTIKTVLEGRGNSRFRLSQDFLLDEAISMYADSLHITYNSQPVTYTLLKEGKGRVDQLIIEKGQTVLTWIFDIPDGVFDNDTIKIAMSGYIQCQEDRPEFAELLYIFKNPITIHGVSTIQ